MSVHLFYVLEYFVNNKNQSTREQKNKVNLMLAAQLYSYITNIENCRLLSKLNALTKCSFKIIYCRNWIFLLMRIESLFHGLELKKLFFWYCITHSNETKFEQTNCKCPYPVGGLV